MPTAEVFEAAARELEREATVVGAIAEPLERRFGPEVLEGGSLTHTLARVVEAAVADHAALQASLLALAETCRDRADLCVKAALDRARFDREWDAYEAEVTSWNGSVRAHRSGEAGVPGPRPTPPEPTRGWPPWAE